jgi:pSer/pThr/pTyr-binding forkhead associated (FHA) protein
MAIQLNQLEQKLQSLIEIHLIKLLPVPSLPNQIAQRLTEAVRANLSTHELASNLPHNFIIKVHPEALPLWQKDPRLLEGLTKILRLAAMDTGLQFGAQPVIVLEGDPSLELDEIRAQIVKLTNVADTEAAEPAVIEEETPQGRTAFLIVGGTKVFTITQAVTNIGRRLDNQLIVDDPRVSRYHAQIRYANGRFIIFDLNSTGGTYVNGQRTNQSVLYPGDVISLAGLPIVFGQDTPPQSLKSGNTAPLSPNSAERNTAILRSPTDEKNFFDDNKS